MSVGSHDHGLMHELLRGFEHTYDVEVVAA